MSVVANVAVNLDARDALATANAFNKSIRNLAVQIGATVSVVNLLKTSLDAAFERQASENRLQSLTKSTKEYQLALNAATIASKRFGVTQTEAQQALGDTLGRLNALGFNLGQVNAIYTGFNVIARESRTSTQDAAGAFLQLSQAMGRGQLSGDELTVIMERMPQLGQAIATSMGVGAESIKQLGSEGKLGVEEIYKALETAAERADKLDKTFTKQQVTMAQVRQRSEELKVSLGNALAPSFLQILNAMSDAVLVLGAGFSTLSAFTATNAESISNIVNVGLKIATIAAGVYLVVKAYQAWQAISKLVAATQAFITTLTPGGLVKIAAATAAAVGVTALLNKAIGEVGKEVAKLKAEGDSTFEKMKKDSLAQLQTLKEQGDQTSANTGKAAKYAAQQSNIKKVLDGQLDTVTSLTAQEQIRLNAAQSRIDNEATVVNAMYGALLNINDLEMQRAKNSGDTQRQYQLQLQKAELIYKQSVLQIQSEIRKAELGALQVKIELQKLKAATLQKAAKGEATQADYDALALQKQAVELAYQGVDAARQAAVYHLQGANAIRQKTVEQAAFNRMQAAGRIGGGGGVGGGGVGGGGAGRVNIVSSGTMSFGGQNYINTLANRLSQAGVTGTFNVQQAANVLAAKSGEQQRGYAEGGYVTRPTNALIGEGGESEYVIPSSKMSSAMQRYSAGVRGEAVTTGAVTAGSTSTANYSSQQNAYYGGGGGTSVNITTGPVIRMNNRDYVTMSDMQRGMAAAANAGQANMMRQLGRSYAVRRSMGL